jgi:hypothetical protein
MVDAQGRGLILYPPSGTVIALNPDIPPELQKIFFLLQTLDKNVNFIMVNPRLCRGTNRV